MRKRSILFLFSCFWGIACLHAQKIDSLLTVYHDNFQQEKTYLHFDKSIYNKGDTIWFKAYLMAGKDLSDYSRNFYVDWYNDKGQLLVHGIFPVFESSARGLFVVPGNYAGGSVSMRAYTQWMLNFDTAFLYSKQITIAQPRSNVVKQWMEKPVVSIHFFPEGGDLIAGINSTIAFSATDQWGKPVSVRGAILTASNELVDSFVSIHDGMGKLSVEPGVGDVYHCNWIDAYGISHTNVLPVVKENGASIQAQVQGTKTIFSIQRTKAAADNYKHLHVIATINQNEIYRGDIDLDRRRIAASEIGTGNLPTGVLQISLFDADWIPVAERVVFVNNHQHQFFPQVNVVVPGLGKRSKNIIEIEVPDTVLTNLSISVTDASLPVDSATNIFSQLLLAGDIRGYVHNPAYYFASGEDSVAQQLDLVMLTHGWRRFKWEELLQGKLPVLSYARDSDYLQIKGKVFGGGRVSLGGGQTLTLIVQGKDSSRQYLVLPVNPDGSFRQRGVIFFDTSRIFYQFNNKKLSDVVAVSFQNGLPLVPYAKKLGEPVVPFAWNNYTDSLLQRNLFFYTEHNRLQRAYDTAHLLKEVTVESRAKTQKEVLDEKYTTGLFTDNNGYSFDVMDDPVAQASLDVLHYLQGKVPGLTMSFSLSPGDTSALVWRNGSPDLFLDEIPSDAFQIQGLQMSNVAYIKVFRPPFMGSSGSGASGAIAIYTRKAGDMKPVYTKGLSYALLAGYAPYKEFYSPDYAINREGAPDTRSTLYWNPYVLTDQKTKTVRLEFYNNDISKRLRIVLEGVNAYGKLARVEKLVQ